MSQVADYSEEPEKKLYTFRPYQASDIPFIQSSWATSYYEGVNGHKQFPTDEFHKSHRPIREKILSNPEATAIICSNIEDNDHIIGWILVEKPKNIPAIKLHYIYVKNAFQGLGIGLELIKMAIPIRPVLYTHCTSRSRKIMKNNWKQGRNDFDRWFLCPHLL